MDRNSRTSPSIPHPQKDASAKGLARSLGEAVGYIVNAIRHDPAKAARFTVRREVEEEHRGPIVLRRTIVEEVELPAKSAPGASPPSSEP